MSDVWFEGTRANPRVHQVRRCVGTYPEGRWEWLDFPQEREGQFDWGNTSLETYFLSLRLLMHVVGSVADARLIAVQFCPVLNAIQSDTWTIHCSQIRQWIGLRSDVQEILAQADRERRGGDCCG